ncbi:MAG: hypothetical protein AAB019_10915, partial [Planctomycetota bacterium]
MRSNGREHGATDASAPGGTRRKKLIEYAVLQKGSNMKWILDWVPFIPINFILKILGYEITG